MAAFAAWLIWLAPIHFCDAQQDRNGGDRNVDGSTVNRDERSLAFRRLLVPAKHVNEEIGGAYLSMSRDRFEAIIARLSLNGAVAERQPALIAASSYYARLEDDDLVEGRAVLQVLRVGDRREWILEPLNVAINAPRWNYDQLGDVSATMYRIDEGDSILRVDAPGTLSFTWSLRSDSSELSSNESDAVFRLALPGAVSGLLWLELPQDRVPHPSHDAISSLVETVPQLGEQLGSTTRLYRIELPRSGTLDLRIVKVQPSEEPRTVGRYRIANNYQVAPDAVVFSSEIKLEPTSEWPAELLLDVDEELFVDRVEMGDGLLPFEWRRVSAEDQRVSASRISSSGSTALQRLAIQLPPGPVASGDRVTIHTLVDFPDRKPRSLPRWRPLDWEWSEETSRIVGGIERLFAIESVSSGLVAEVAGNGEATNWSKTVYHNDSTSSIKLALVLPQNELQIEQATVLTAAAGSLTATTHARLTTRRGELFELSFEMPSHWQINSVLGFPLGLSDQSQPSITGPINVVERWQSSSLDEMTQQVRVRLSFPISRRSPIRLVVSAVRVPFPDQFEPLTRHDFDQVRFEDAIVHRNCLGLVADAPFRYQLESDARCHRLERDELPLFFQNLSPQTPFDLLTELDDQTADLQARVQIQPMAIVDAEISTDVLVEPGQLTETYTLDCDPRAAKIDHLEIHFSEARGDEIEWRLESPKNDRIRAQRIDSDPTSVQPNSGETWRIELFQPRESSFRLIGTRVSPLRNRMNVSLATARRALPQSCRVSVRARGMVQPAIEATTMTPCPTPPQDEERQERVCGAFGYDPGAMASTSLVIDISERNQPSHSYLILQQVIESQLIEDRVIHRVMCDVETHGTRRLLISLPRDASLGRVTIDAGSVAAVKVSGESGHFELQIGEDAPERFTLELSYSVPANLPIFCGKVILEALQFDGKVFDSQWSVSGPSDFLLLGPTESDSNLARPWWSIMRRLFQPLLDERRTDGNASPSVRALSLTRMGSIGAIDEAQPTEQAVYATIRVYNRSMLSLLQYSLLFFACLLTWRLARISKRRAVFVLIVVLISAVLAPMTWSFWIAPVFSGGAFGLLIRWTGDLLVQSKSPITTRPRQRIAITAIWLLASAIFTHSLFAHSPSGRLETTPQDRSILVADERDDGEYAKVVVPVDENREPVGGLVYLPRDFYDRLLRADLKEGSGQRWGQILSIEYRVDGDWAESRNAPRTVVVTARIQIMTTRRNARFVLPFDPTEIALIQGELRLEGEPPVVEALADERLVVEIPQVGENWLEVSFVPRFNRTFGVNLISFSIPRIHRAKCRVTTSALAPSLRFPSRRGAMRYDSLRGIYDVDLGPARTLQIQWKSRDLGPLATDQQSIQRLFWMTVSPQSVFVDGTVQIRTSRSMTEATMTLPYRYVPYWRQLFDDQTVEILKQATPEENGMLKVSRADGSDAFHLNFTLLREASSGVGQFRFPDVWFGLSDRNEDRFALSGAEGLSVRFDDTRSTLPVRVNEFARLWEESAGIQRSPPLQVRYPVVGETVPAIRSRRNEARTSVAERMSLMVGRESTTVQYRANIAIAQGRVPQISLATPAGFRIRSVRRIEDGRRVELSWLTDVDGRLLIQPLNMLSGEVQIEVEGDLDTNRHGRLPTLAMQHVEARQVLIDVFRDEAMQVLLLKGDELWPGGDERLVEGAGRRVATINLVNETADDFSMDVDLRSLDESQTWQIVTAVERRSEGWYADVEVTVDFPEAAMPQMDACRFRIGDGWSGPFSVDLDGQTRFDQSPDGSEGVLLIEPTLPIRGRITFHVTGPLATPVRVPNVMPVTNSENVARQVLLPRRLESESLRWNFTGLEPAEALEVPMADASSSDPGIDRFNVQPGPFEAVIRSVDQVRRQASVELMELQVVLQADGHFTTIARVDLLPSGTDTLSVILPDGCELLSMQLDELPVQSRKSANDQWEIALPTPQLPSHLLIAYQGCVPVEMGKSTSDIEMGALRFPGVTVARTTWSVQVPLERSWKLLGDEGNAETRASLRVKRLSTINQVMEEAMNQLLELNDLDRSRWFAKWNRRFVGEAQRMEAGQAFALRVADSSSEELDTLVERHRDLTSQLGLMEQVEADDPSTLSPVSSWQQQIEERSARGRTQYWSTPSDRILLHVPDYVHQNRSPWSRAVVVALGLVAIALGLTKRVQTWGVEHSNWICAAMLAGCGLIWLNWFMFPWLGFCFLGMSLALCARRLDARRRKVVGRNAPV